jgi:Na+-transporting NADH:ubiquinone oxidoreductase subunit F
MLAITSIVAFTAVILVLVALLIFAQKYLVQSGPVKILINGEKTITVAVEHRC